MKKVIKQFLETVPNIYLKDAVEAIEETYIDRGQQFPLITIEDANELFKQADDMIYKLEDLKESLP